MIVQHNIMAINSHRQLSVNNNNLQKNLEKLSSGYRINKAADDAAGLAISEKMRAQITGLERASLNAKDGASLIQTAEGALTEVHSMLNRMVELATQSANGTIQDIDRGKIESELNALKEEIDRISEATDFNGIKLLNGSRQGVKYVPETAIEIAKDAPVGSAKTVGTATLAPPPGFADTGKGTLTATTDGKNKVAITFTDAKGVAVTRTITISAKGLNLASAGKNTVNLQDSTGANWGSITLKNTDDIGDSDAFAKAIADSVKGAFSASPKVASTYHANNLEGQGLVLQVGDTSDSYNKITVSVEDMSAAGLGIDDIHMDTQDAASEALRSVKAAIEKVSINRGNLGALQNRLDHTISNLGVTTENMTAAESRIRDVDMAKEMMHFTKNNVLSQAAQAMLAQANMQPQQVLQLLR